MPQPAACSSVTFVSASSMRAVHAIITSGSNPRSVATSRRVFPTRPRELSTLSTHRPRATSARPHGASSMQEFNALHFPQWRRDCFTYTSSVRTRGRLIPVRPEPVALGAGLATRQAEAMISRCAARVEANAMLWTKRAHRNHNPSYRKLRIAARSQTLECPCEVPTRQRKRKGAEDSLAALLFHLRLPLAVVALAKCFSEAHCDRHPLVSRSRRQSLRSNRRLRRHGNASPGKRTCLDLGVGEAGKGETCVWRGWVGGGALWWWWVGGVRWEG